MNLEDGTKEKEIEGSFKRKKGTFWTKVRSPAFFAAIQ